MLGPIDQPVRRSLEVDLYSGRDKQMYIVGNKEKAALQELKITAYPPPLRGNTLDPKRSFFKIIGAVAQGGLITVEADEMKNDQGELLSDARMKVGVIHLSGKVNGEIKETFITVTGKKK
jgi:hypothetical protein